MLSVVGAYAEYYGCLPRVAPVLLDVLFAHPCIWRAVDEHPYECLQLATNLRCAELYLDALRHLLSRAERDNFKTVSTISGQSAEGSKAWIKPMMDDNAAAERNLEKALNMRHLSKGFTIEDRVITYIPTTYPNMIDFEENHSRKMHSEEMLAMERSRMLAGNIFSQWWQQLLAGEEVYIDNTPRARQAGSIAHAMFKLKSAVKWHVPANMFGKSSRGKTVVQQYVEDFAQCHRFNADKQIKLALKSLVEEAVAEVDDKFPSCSETVDGVEYTYRLTNYMGIESKITYFGLDESDLPWNEDWPWPELVDLPAANVKIASGHKLRMVGIFKA